MLDVRLAAALFAAVRRALICCWWATSISSLGRAGNVLKDLIA